MSGTAVISKAGLLREPSPVFFEYLKTSGRRL